MKISLKVVGVSLHKFIFYIATLIFLLAVGSGCDKALVSIEKEADEPLRRDKNERLRQFSKESETATTRLIRLACDFLGPRGDEKSGCR